MFIYFIGCNQTAIVLSFRIGYDRLNGSQILFHYRSSRSSVHNYSHPDSNKNGNDKGSHLNNGSRVQKDGSKVGNIKILT